GERGAQLRAGVGDERTQARAELDAALEDGVERERRLAEERFQVAVLLAQALREHLRKPRLVEQVADADPGAGHLVLVRGPDAAAGGADLSRAPQALARPVDGAMVRHDEMRLLADPQP